MIPEAIRVRMDELAAKRREKQPLEYPSAGEAPLSALRAISPEN
ncbi:MAG: hypothetical protein ACLT76_08635 [Clostridium fessum]